MHYASVQQLTKSFGARTLFSNISFHVEEGDKIALVARNGLGKSTLLHILAGLETADSGTVWIHKDIRVVFLRQEAPFREQESIWDNVLRLDNPVVKAVKAYEEYIESGREDAAELTRLMSELDALNAWSFESDLRQILGKLQLHNLQTKMIHLSGGQKKRVALAQALVEMRLYDGRCLLLMDEPTNHLDVVMIEWLEDFLSAERVTLLLVTHDRYFLDAVCNEILEIDDEQVYTHTGDYAYFLEQRALRIEVQQSELQKDKNIYRRELEWMRKQPQARTTKSKSRQDAFHQLDEKLRSQREEPELQLQMKMTRLGGKILELKKIYKSYGDNVLIHGFDYTFKRGERVGIVGPNGVGKSTFLRIALQELEPDSGKINHGETVVFGHFSQEGLVYKEDKKALDYVKDMAEFFPLADGTKISASQFMERFGFSGAQQHTFLSKLSGGERRRLHLLGILFRNPNFLVLDEPTNDLDLQTLSTLEAFLVDYPGCVLMVSHDRYFMDRLTDHLLVFEGKGYIRDFPGNYTQYREARELELAAAKEQEKAQAAKQASSATPVEVAPKAASKKLSFNEKRELDQLDKELPELQAEKAKLEAELAAGQLEYAALQAAAARIGTLIEEIETKEWRWLELSERAG